MNSERGSALILALLMLTFLMILGGALLTSVTLDVAIGDNYRTETQLLYLAETGVEEARAFLQSTSSAPSQLLSAAAAADGLLSASRDPDTLLNLTDDIPLIKGGGRNEPKQLLDTSGKSAGSYYVFLRNDSADGITNLNDKNQVLTLLSVAVIGNSRKVLEVKVMKWRFPKLPASLVLNGSPAYFTPSNSSSGISGIDNSTKGADELALGVLTEADRMEVLASIPDSSEVHYPGSGNWTPPPADVGVIDKLLDPRLNSPASMERIVDGIVANASSVYEPGWNGTTVIANTGNPSDYRVIAVNGNCSLESGTGYGILLVRGNLVMSGDFQWNGLILVIGQGMVSLASGNGVISGAVFVARTRADDRNAGNSLGTMLAERGAVHVDFGGTGATSQISNPGNANMELANQKFPWVPIAIREY